MELILKYAKFAHIGADATVNVFCVQFNVLYEFELIVGVTEICSVIP